MDHLLWSIHVFSQLAVHISHNSITVEFQHNPPLCAEATSGWWWVVVWLYSVCAVRNTTLEKI